MENTLKCDCCQSTTHISTPGKGYYIKKLLPELRNKLEHYDALMNSEIEEVKKEKKKSNTNLPYFDIEIANIISNYTTLKNAISIGYFIKKE
jgi:hypothetical protein